MLLNSVKCFKLFFDLARIELNLVLLFLYTHWYAKNGK